MRRNERRGGIERKILTTILWVGITPIALALIFGYAVTHEGQRRAVQHTLEIAAQKTANGILFALNARLSRVGTLARDTEVAAMLRGEEDMTPERVAALKTRLAIEAENADDSLSIYALFDARGKLILSTGELSDAETVHEGWAESIDKADFVDFQYSEELKGNFARAVAPVYLPETGELLGFLSEDQGIDTLMNFTPTRASKDSLGVDTYQFAFLLGGGMLVYPRLEPQAPMPAPDSPNLVLQTAMSEPDPQIAGSMRLRRYQTKGGVLDVLLAFHRVLGDGESYKVYVIVYRPALAVFRNINLWAIYSILGTVVVIGLFCIIAYRNVHNNIVVPVSLLNEGAQIIRQGDLDLKLKVDTGDEIEELASSFNQMAQALSHNTRQLEDSEEKYRNLVTSMRDGIYQRDPEGIITFVNPAGADIFGYESPEDTVGRDMRELFLEEIDYARVANEIEKQSFIERTRVWMKRKDGRTICIELSGNRVFDDDNKLLGAEGIFRDVTRSVRLEQQARERSEWISAINQIANVINSSLEAGRLHESLVIELRKLVNFDYAAVALSSENEDDTFELLRLWPELENGQSGGDHTYGTSACALWVAREKECLLVDELDESAVSFAAEFPPETRSCLCVPLYASGAIMGTLKLGSNVTGAFSKHDIEVLEETAPHIAVAMRNARLLDNLQQTIEDVTRAREKLHEANEELKTLDEMKTNLLSNVSHELRTPLVAVMGYTDMILNEKAGGINDTQAEYLGIIMRNVEKLVTLIENLLDFSRLHRGAEKIVFDLFDVVDCARTSMQIVQPVADKRTIALTLVVSEEPIFVDGDKGKMGQVFNNLLANAVKFNHDKGGVKIDIRRRDDSVEVAVSDTGIGIPPEAIEKVFTRFYQYDSSSTRKYGGTGIGLAIAQDIVRLHGSRITVTSEFGKGSTFRFSLLLGDPAVSQAPEAQQEESVLSGDTRLLIEVVAQDRALNAQLRDYLTPEGMDLIHTTNAVDALALVHKYNPDCMLVDAETVGHDHPLVLDDLLADEAATALPIIILTNDDALYERYRSAVASRIKRDFRKSTLLSGIHYALGQAGEGSPDTQAGDAPADLRDLKKTEPLGDKILCVDDDPEILVFIKRCLETEGYAADSCLSGQAALECLASHEYGLVLLDIAMPGLDGWETCRKIKSDPGLAGLKVYFVTAKPIDRASSRIEEVRADGYLLKPFKPEDLIDLVRGFMGVRPSAGQAPPGVAGPGSESSIEPKTEDA